MKTINETRSSDKNPSQVLSDNDASMSNGFISKAMPIKNSFGSTITGRIDDEQTNTISNKTSWGNQQANYLNLKEEFTEVITFGLTRKSQPILFHAKVIYNSYKYS